MPGAAKLRVSLGYFHIRLVPDAGVGEGCLESLPCHAEIRELNPPSESGLPVSAWRRR